MKKDIEWLKEEIGDLPITDTVFISDNVSYIDSAVSVTSVYDLIDQLDEPEKVVVPQFVAIEFDYDKKPYWEVDESKDVSHILKCAFSNEAKPSEFLDWVRENPEDYVMAVRNGYKMKEEQKYYVDLDTAAYVAKWKDDDRVDIYTDGISGSDGFEFHLTEEEIKNYDERFWPFAKPVE